MRFKSLTGKLLFVGGIALANTTFYVSSEHLFTGHIRGEATRINMAGHMRFLSFEMAWLLHRVTGDGRPELRASLLDKIEEFKSISDSLRTGRKDMGVKPVSASGEEAAALDVIINEWEGRIRPMVFEIMEHPEDKQTLDKYDSVIIGYVQEIDAFVGVLETHFKDRIRNFDIFRAYALGLFVIVSLFIAFYIRKNIIKPVGMLKDAAKEIGSGNFDAKIDVKNDDDIGLLAGTINEMALGLKGAMTNLESLVQQRTEELAATNEEMIASNEELQAAYSELEATSEELEKANEELKSLEKLKIDFLQTISHELRSPLSPILGYLELMRDGDIGELTERQKGVIEEMHICGKNMQMIVDELLEVASIQSGNLFMEFEDVDLRLILSHAIKDIKKYADEKMIEIETMLPGGPVHIEGDRRSLIEIFIHLLRNSVKFNHKEGKVEVEIAVREENVEINVSDTGIGIPKDKLDKIYEAFYQVESSSSRHYEGVGLGLYLVKRLVDIHNGSIRVESHEGKGTTFMVSIPKNRRRRPSEASHA